MGVRTYLAAIFCLALVLRGWYINTRSLWFDEAFSWRMARLPVRELVERTTRDHNPPLYYIVLHWWMRMLGESPWILRLPSVLCGALTVLAGAWLAAEVARYRGSASSVVRAALLAALLLALNSAQIRWGGEARMYSLGTLLALACTALLVRALHAQRDARLWSAYTMVTVHRYHAARGLDTEGATRPMV